MAQQFPTRSRNNGRVVFGTLIAGIGVLILLQMLHILPSIWYTFHIGWPVLLIVIGAMLGIKNNFRNNAWWILILVGAFNLIPVFEIADGVTSKRIAWPLLLILAGLAMVFRNKNGRWHRDRMELVTNGESLLNIDVTFGGRKEIVTSKEFRGGRVSTTFGGAEINLMQADSTEQPIVLEVRVSFGGVEIIVPSHWEVINEIDPSFGSVEDHRHIRMAEPGTERRTLILRGSCSFGSVEVKSY